jgi:hypothetical protein
MFMLLVVFAQSCLAFVATMLHPPGKGGISVLELLLYLWTGMFLLIEFKVRRDIVFALAETHESGKPVAVDDLADIVITPQ